MRFRSCNIALVLIYFWSIQNPHSALTGSNTATNTAHVDFFIVSHWKLFPWLQSKQALQLFSRETALKTPKSTCSQWGGQYWSKQQQINTRYDSWENNNSMQTWGKRNQRVERIETYHHSATSSPARVHPSPQTMYNKTQCCDGGTDSSPGSLSAHRKTNTNTQYNITGSRKKQVLRHCSHSPIIRKNIFSLSPSLSLLQKIYNLYCRQRWKLGKKTTVLQNSHDTVTQMTGVSWGS